MFIKIMGIWYVKIWGLEIVIFMVVFLCLGEEDLCFVMSVGLCWELRYFYCNGRVQQS